MLVLHHNVWRCITIYGSIISELLPVRWIGLTPHPPGGCFFAYAHSSSV